MIQLAATAFYSLEFINSEISLHSVVMTIFLCAPFLTNYIFLQVIVQVVNKREADYKQHK